MIVLIFNSILLGVGLAMDAFSVSVANGLRESHMKGSRMMLIAGTFAVFQMLMPLIGWFLIRTATEAFSSLSIFIPYVAFGLLAFIGGKMVWEAMKPETEEEAAAETGDRPVTFGNLMVQGVATSIDALSVGFAIAAYSRIDAVIASVIVGIVTLVICLAGLILGKTIGSKLKEKATILGGVILIAIGIEILVTGIIK